MPFKDLLVHLDATEAGARRLDYALRLAAREEAHLAGVYTLDLEPQLSQLARAYPGRVEQYETFIETRRAAFDQAKRVEAQFRDALRRQGIEGEWRLVEGAPAERMMVHARYVDLAIVGQIDPAQAIVSDEDRIPEEVLLASGRPLLVVPFAGQFETVGENILVAWKPTAEAARAMAGALPLLERAKKVTVLTVNPNRGIIPNRACPSPISRFIWRAIACVPKPRPLSPTTSQTEMRCSITFPIAAPTCSSWEVMAIAARAKPCSAASRERSFAR